MTMTTKTKRTKITTQAAPAQSAAQRCAYEDCRAPLPGPYGTAGVSLSRADSETLICSRCGTREALTPALLGTRFKGEGWA